MDPSSANKLDNKRVAKNALLLTIRMIVVTLVGLYTSRVVFAQLGDVNYGVYGVVGGIMGFVGFLTSAMAGASSRFITYEIGHGMPDSINAIFNASLLVHCGIAVVIVIVGESLGQWLLNDVLVIPRDRLDAAWWVFQFSVISTAISITQVPYSAVIMAYEKMNIYAYMEFVNLSLKLLVVYLLSISHHDKLIVYSFLLMLIGLLMMTFYRLYCIRKFSVCKLRKIRDFSMVKKLLSFSLMDLYGNIGVTVNNQGLTYAINIFFGLVYNAAVSLANTVNGMLLSLTTTIAIAFKPQIVKQYAQGNIRNMETVMSNSVKFTLLAIALISVPAAFEAPFIMKLWLGEVPDYCVEFLRILIIQSFVPIINNVCNAAIHANGNIKLLTFVNGSVFMLMPVAVFCAFHFGADVLWGYGIEIIGMIVIVIIAINIVKHLIPEFRAFSFVKTILQCFFVILSSTVPVFVIYSIMPFGFMRVVTVSLSYALVLTSISWITILTKENRMLVKNKAISILSKFRF